MPGLRNGSFLPIKKTGNYTDSVGTDFHIPVRQKLARESPAAPCDTVRNGDSAVPDQGGINMSSISNVEESVGRSYMAESERKASDARKAAEAGRAEDTRKAGNFGKTIGQPKLSDKAAKYYEELKKKFSNMDFILVSADQKENAKAQAGNYANPVKTVVLIDEEKLEKMAEDETFRAQYEGIIRSASVQMNQLKKNVGSNSCVKGFGMQVDDNGKVSFFAVVDKSLAAQKDRIARKAEEKKANAKKEAKKSEKEKRAEALEERQKAGRAEKDYVTVTASSIDELQKKVDNVLYSAWSDNTRTDEEKMWGRNIDFRL